MKENDSFSMCHPLLNFFYFAVALLFTMFNQHPVFLGISYAGAFVYGGLLNGWRKTLKQGLLLTLPGLLIIALLNPMFNHYGVTMLYYIESSWNWITLEALVNGGIRDMIYTVTFNPSLDYIVGVDEFKTGKVNRTAEELILPGGKGINVSIVLQNLGMESIPLGFAGGFTGEEIRRLMKERKIEEQFVRVKKGISRINVKLRSLQVGENGEKTVSEESEINGMGPEISGEELEIFYQQLDALQKGDILVLAGSIPTVLPSTIYRDIMKRLQKREVMIVVDATKNLLVNVLEYHPFLIKPNNYELGEIFGVTLSTKEDVILYAKKLQEMGAANVLVSMAGDGAVLVAEDGSTYKSEAPEGKVKNSVGAGDSMVAGFLYGYLKSGIYEDAFYYGVCTGSASAFSENLATREEVDTLLRNIKNRA